MVLVYSGGRLWNPIWLRLQGYSVELLAMVLVLSDWGVWEHSLVKVAKLQNKTACHGPGLFWSGCWENSLVKVAKLQCKTAGHCPYQFWRGLWEESG